MKKIIVVFFSSLIFSGILQAQDQAPKQSNIAPSWSVPELITDRPDQTESSCTVPKNSLQVETGFVYENFKKDDLEFENWGIATTLLRYGVWDNFELRLGSYYQLSSVQSEIHKIDTTQSGIGPIMVGFKVFVVEEKGIRPEISIMADLTLNKVGNLDYRPAYTYSSIKILASHTLSDFFSLGYNFGYGNDGESAGGFFVYTIKMYFINFGLTWRIPR